MPGRFQSPFPLDWQKLEEGLRGLDGEGWFPRARSFSRRRKSTLPSASSRVRFCRDKVQPRPDAARGLRLRGLCRDLAISTVAGTCEQVVEWREKLMQEQKRCSSTLAPVLEGGSGGRASTASPHTATCPFEEGYISTGAPHQTRPPANFWRGGRVKARFMDVGDRGLLLADWLFVPLCPSMHFFLASTKTTSTVDDDQRQIEAVA